MVLKLGVSGVLLILKLKSVRRPRCTFNPEAEILLGVSGVQFILKLLFILKLTSFQAHQVYF